MYEQTHIPSVSDVSDGSAAGAAAWMVSRMREGDIRTEPGAMPPMSETSLRCVTPPVIENRTEAVLLQITRQLAQVRSLPKTLESMPQVKQLRADLNRQFQQYEQQRKDVKKQILAPYEQAELLYKARIADPYKEADTQLKAWVDDVSAHVKDQCRQRLMAYFNELRDALGIDFVEFDQCGITVDMATAQQKTPRRAMQTIHDFLTRISDDMQAISLLPDPDAVMVHYRKCLSVSGAVAAMERGRQEADAAARSLTSFQAQAEATQENLRRFKDRAPEAHPDAKCFTVTFSVTATVPMLRGLKAFLEANNYVFTEE